MIATKLSPRRRALLLPVAVVCALVTGCGDSGTSAGPGNAVEASSGSSRPASSSTSARGREGEESTSTKKRSTSSTTTESTDPSTTTEPTETTETTDQAGPSSTTDEAALARACDLITEADAARALGEPVVAGDQRRDECWWSTANDLKTVNIIRRSDDLDVWRSGYQNSKWEKVDRGDEGYEGKGLTSIVFRIGETQYEINVVFSTKGDPRQVVNDLADTVLGRL